MTAAYNALGELLGVLLVISGVANLGALAFAALYRMRILPGCRPRGQKRPRATNVYERRLLAHSRQQVYAMQRHLDPDEIDRILADEHPSLTMNLAFIGESYDPAIRRLAATTLILGLPHEDQEEFLIGMMRGIAPIPTPQETNR